MPKYNIRFAERSWRYASIDIEAPTELAAREMAWNAYEENGEKMDWSDPEVDDAEIIGCHKED